MRNKRISPIKIAVIFHETYERLAHKYGYETRKETKLFNASSPNGKLMIEVCREMQGYILSRAGELEVPVIKEEVNMIKKLELRNFRIESEGWELKDYGKVTCKVNPKGDVIEYVSGVAKELKGEQLFTWDAAMRETKKVGKRMPTEEEWEEVREEVVGCGIYPGYLNNSSGALGYRGSYGYYWSSTQYSTAYGYYLGFNSSSSDMDFDNKAYGFSVRCLSDVGELEDTVLSVEEIMEVMKIKGNEIGEVMFGWERKMQAEAIHKAMVEKRGKK